MEPPNQDKSTFYCNQAAKVLSTKNIIISPTREGVNGVIIFLTGHTTDLTYLHQVFSQTPTTTPTVVCVLGSKDLPHDYAKKVDSWIYGCKLPKKVPTPIILDGNNQEMNITRMINFIATKFSGPQEKMRS